MLKHEFPEVPMRNAQLSRPVALALVLLVATLLAARPIGLGLDDQNYLDYFSNINQIFSYYEGLSYVFNEPLWLAFCYAANASFGDEGGLRFIIFMGAAFAGIGVARMNRWAILPIVLYFALPPSLKNHVDHLRQGLAVGLYVLFFSASGWCKTLRFVTPFVHSSFWVMIAIDVMVARFYKTHPEHTRFDAVLILLVAAGISVAFSSGVEKVAAELGFRQVDIYIFLASEGTGAAFLGWLVLLPVLLFLANRKYFGSFAAYLGFYLGGYYFSPVAARIFENSFFLLASAVPASPPSRRIAFCVVMIIMSIVFAITGNLYPRLLDLFAV